MPRYCTKDGRRVSIFTPITRKELAEMPDASTWRTRAEFIDDAAYKDLQRLIMEAFATESTDYILGYVTGFNGAVERLRDFVQDEESYEAVWNKLMLLLSEAARYVPRDSADDERDYLRIPSGPDHLPN